MKKNTLLPVVFVFVAFFGPLLFLLITNYSQEGSYFSDCPGPGCPGKWVDPIIIENEQDLEDLKIYSWFSGSGTKEDPYVFDNIYIEEASSQVDAFVYIKDVRKYIRFQDAYIDQWTGDSSRLFYLENVSNLEIINSHLYSDGVEAIRMVDCSNISLEEIEFNAIQYSSMNTIRLENCNNCLIEDSLFQVDPENIATNWRHGNAIHAEDGKNITILNSEFRNYNDSSSNLSVMEFYRTSNVRLLSNGLLDNSLKFSARFQGTSGELLEGNCLITHNKFRGEFLSNNYNNLTLISNYFQEGVDIRSGCHKIEKNIFNTSSLELSYQDLSIYVENSSIQHNKFNGESSNLILTRTENNTIYNNTFIRSLSNYPIIGSQERDTVIFNYINESCLPFAVSNTNITEMAQADEITGDGSELNPYLLEGIEFVCYFEPNVLQFIDFNHSFILNKAILRNHGSQNGIKLYNSSFITINNTIVRDFDNFAIHLNSSHNNSLTRSEFSYSRKGMVLSGDSENNTITGNYFVENTINAEDNSSLNFWNSTEKGNYYSDYAGQDLDDDYVGDTPHLIQGTAGSADFIPIYWDGPHLPLPFTIQSTSYYEGFEGPFLLEWDFPLLTEDFSIMVNGQEYDKIGDTTYLIELEDKTYDIEVRANNYYGYRASNNIHLEPLEQYIFSLQEEDIIFPLITISNIDDNDYRVSVDLDLDQATTYYRVSLPDGYSDSFEFETTINDDSITTMRRYGDVTEWKYEDLENKKGKLTFGLTTPSIAKVERDLSFFPKEAEFFDIDASRVLTNVIVEYQIPLPLQEVEVFYIEETNKDPRFYSDQNIQISNERITLEEGQGWTTITIELDKMNAQEQFIITYTTASMIAIYITIIVAVSVAGVIIAVLIIRKVSRNKKNKERMGKNLE